MARPRVMSVENGKVELHGFDPAVADKLQEYLKKFNVEDTVQQTPQPTVVLKEVAPIDGLNDVAIGLRKNKEKKLYEVVVVKYNVLTKEARVEQVKEAGAWRELGINNFKSEIIAQRLFD